ncbi:MAG: hypothetical protein MUC83_13785, partial [Pirellula sp.]|nr:hypothetical protein [Pirellula sp.]
QDFGQLAGDASNLWPDRLRDGSRSRQDFGPPPCNTSIHYCLPLMQWGGTVQLLASIELTIQRVSKLEPQAP